MKSQSGFTVIEIIIAVAVIGVLASVGVMNYNSWRNRAVVSEAAYQIAQNVEKARSESKRLNETRKLNFTPSTDTNTVTRYLYQDSAGTTLSNVKLPDGAKVSLVKEDGTSKTSTTLQFDAPYGTQGTSVGYYDIVIQSRQSSSVTKTVRVVGPLGKVVIL